MSQVVGLPNNAYKPITNTAQVRARLWKLQKKGSLDSQSQVIKFTSCLLVVSGSLTPKIKSFNIQPSFFCFVFVFFCFLFFKFVLVVNLAFKMFEIEHNWGIMYEMLHIWCTILTQSETIDILSVSLFIPYMQQ